MGNSKIVVGSVLLGLGVFVGLGAFGFGTDTVGEIALNTGLQEEAASRVSRLLTGVLAAGAVFLGTYGYSEGQDGHPVSSERVRQVMREYQGH